MTQTISTIVDEEERSPDAFKVYMTQTISTIVDVRHGEGVDN